jgi:hypothetical protein
MHASLARVARLVLVTTALMLSLVTPVAAKESVDPSTLNPPPPAEFNPVCERLGGGIVCDLAFSDPPVIDQPGELFCDGDQIFESWTRSVVGRRIYDADGNLLKRQFQEDLVGSFTNPSSGVTVDWVSHATNIHVLSVPGDLGSGVSSGAGLSIRITAPDGGTVLIDAGRLVFDGATGDFLASHGPHHFDDYFARGDVDALQPLCDALA